LGGELSAISVAFQNSGIDAGGATLFSTRWPNLVEMRLILAMGVSPIYFFGPVNDPESVRLVNDFSESSHKPVETIKLEVSTSS
jgi:hypothetical protein